MTQKDRVCTKYIPLYIKISKFYGYSYSPLAFPGGSAVKNLPANAGATGDAGSILGLGDSLEKEMATPPIFLLGKSHGQRSLMEYRP